MSECEHTICLHFSLIIQVLVSFRGLIDMKVYESPHKLSRIHLTTNHIHLSIYKSFIIHPMFYSGGVRDFAVRRLVRRAGKRVVHLNPLHSQCHTIHTHTNNDLSFCDMYIHTYIQWTGGHPPGSGGAQTGRGGY